MAFFLGIDGGGSKTSCLIGDETAVLGSGTSGASNLTRVSDAEARQAFSSSIHQACAAAKIDPAQISHTCVGVAGAARPQTSETVRRLVAEIVAGQIEVAGDNAITLEAAFGSGPGVIVIAGTGSIAYGRNTQGQTARAGGWGFAISDEGSGQWIGRAWIAAVMRAHDEDESDVEEAGSNSLLLANLMKSLGVETLDQLVPAANALPARDFAGMFPAVLAASDSGDTIAHEVLTRGAGELATLAKIVIRRLFPGAASVPVAMSGGVFENSALVRQVFYNCLRSEYSNAVVKATVVDPVQGALALARRGMKS